MLCNINSVASNGDSAIRSAIPIILAMICILTGCAPKHSFDWEHADYGITGHEGDEVYDESKK